MDVSIVFLSRVCDENSSFLLKQAIESFTLSTSKFIFEIIIVESGDVEHTQRIIGDKGIVVPYLLSEFNFHKALNIGLQKTQGKLICFSNNDVIFYKDWFKNIYNVLGANDLDLVSPVDPNEDKLWMVNKNDKKFVEGYEIQKHFKGWCFVVHKRVFRVIEKFDERFDFYFADNDFITQIEFAGFRHAAVLNSHVHHLEKEHQQPIEKEVYALLVRQNIAMQKIPGYVIKENRWWLVENRKMIDGLLNYHHKWGSYKIIKFKKLIAHYLHKNNMNILARFLFLK